jgi:SAM-dependent methyltransferase
MSHELQQDFFKRVKEHLPNFFTDVKVLDVGSLDINGNIKHNFTQPFYYVGLDLDKGPNVDVICPGHLYESGFKFDVVSSAECFEHDMYYARTLQNMIRLLRPGGLLIFTCASTGRPEHGTLRSSPSDAPFLQGVDEKWANYYKNLTEDDIRAVIDINNTFSEFNFEFEPRSCDLYFWGIKKY